MDILLKHAIDYTSYAIGAINDTAMWEKTPSLYEESMARARKNLAEAIARLDAYESERAKKDAA